MKESHREWVGSVSLSNGRYWRTASVRVRASSVDPAVRRAVSLARYTLKQRQSQRILRIAGLKLTLVPVRANGKEGSHGKTL